MPKREVETLSLNRTNQCRFDFLCLESDHYPLCLPKYTVSDLTALRQGQVRECSYQIRFGNQTYCTCPTRAILFLKYNC